MFPLLRNRAARALDVAIEFATLGEYRLADPIAPVAPARGARRRPEPVERREGAPARPAARLVVEGEVRHVFIDPATKAKREMPAEIRAALEPYAEAREAAA